MVTILDRIEIPDDELEWSYSRSGGPGGQNVNKVASKVELRWRLAASTVLPDAVKARLQVQQRGRITTGGELLVTSQKTRDQGRNRDDCVEKLRAMIVQALTPPKKRRPTKPTRGSKEARLSDKRRRAATKSTRRGSSDE